MNIFQTPSPLSLTGNMKLTCFRSGVIIHGPVSPENVSLASVLSIVRNISIKPGIKRYQKFFTFRAAVDFS